MHHHDRISTALSIAIKALAVATLVFASVRLAAPDAVLGPSPPATFWVLAVARALAGLEALTCPTSTSQERPAALNLLAVLLMLTTVSLMVSTVARPPLPTDDQLRQTFDRTYCAARALDACQTDGTALETYAVLFSDLNTPQHVLIKATPGVGGMGPRRRHLETSLNDGTTAEILSDTLKRCRGLLLKRQVWRHAASDVAGRAIDDGELELLKLFPPSDATDAWCGAYLKGVGRDDVAKYVRPNAMETIAAQPNQSPFDAHYVDLQAYINEKRLQIPMDWLLQWLVMALRLGIVCMDVVAAMRRARASASDACACRSCDDELVGRKRAAKAAGTRVERLV